MNSLFHRFRGVSSLLKDLPTPSFFWMVTSIVVRAGRVPGAGKIGGRTSSENSQLYISKTLVKKRKE